MEKLIKSFNELKVGDLVLIVSPMTKEDEVCVVSSIIQTHKYPISNVGCNRKYYYKDRKAVYADECGEIGNEMINEYGISSGAGEYTFREDDEPIWNIRLIDKSHPKWDRGLEMSGKLQSSVLNIFGSLFSK